MKNNRKLFLALFVFNLALLFIALGHLIGINMALEVLRLPLIVVELAIVAMLFSDLFLSKYNLPIKLKGTLYGILLILYSFIFWYIIFIIILWLPEDSSHNLMIGIESLKVLLILLLHVINSIGLFFYFSSGLKVSLGL